MKKLLSVMLASLVAVPLAFANNSTIPIVKSPYHFDSCDFLNVSYDACIS